MGPKKPVDDGEGGSISKNGSIGSLQRTLFTNYVPFHTLTPLYILDLIEEAKIHGSNSSTFSELQKQASKQKTQLLGSYFGISFLLHFGV